MKIIFNCAVIISLQRKYIWLGLRIGRAWKISEENVSLIENREQTHLVDSSGQEICARCKTPTNRISQGI